MSRPSEGDAHPEGSWQLDPFGRHRQRWWNGTTWSERVRDGKLDGIDPPGIVARPEGHGVAHTPAQPISEPVEPVHYRPLHLPRVLLLAVVVLLAIVVLIGVTVATA
jgi:hypothetical protein